MKAVKWIVQGLFLILPLVCCIGFMIIRGLLIPIIGGDGVDGIIAFLKDKEAPLFFKQVGVLIVLNFLFPRGWDAAAKAYEVIERVLIDGIDALYDRMLGGPYGRGDSSIAILVTSLLYLACFLLAVFMAFIIASYVCFVGLNDFHWSWEGWMGMKFAEVITYRIAPLTFILAVFTEPVLHLVDRPVRGFAEKTMSCIRTKINSKKKEEGVKE